LNELQSDTSDSKTRKRRQMYMALEDRYNVVVLPLNLELFLSKSNRNMNFSVVTRVGSE
jgi:hypothetical protein